MAARQPKARARPPSARLQRAAASWTICSTPPSRAWSIDRLGRSLIDLAERANTSKRATFVSRPAVNRHNNARWPPDVSDLWGFCRVRAVNAAAANHPAKERLEFVGKALFIPIFFIVTGFLIVPVAIGQTIFNNFWLVAGMVIVLIVGKGIAATIAGHIFGYA
jgi:hypothetical protein